MDIESLILKKNNKQVLTKKEIQFFIDNYCDNKITEEQAVRFIKAIYDNGLNYTHNSFGVLFSTAFLSSVPRFIDSLRGNTSVVT